MKIKFIISALFILASLTTLTSCLKNGESSCSYTAQLAIVPAGGDANDAFAQSVLNLYGTNAPSGMSVSMTGPTDCGIYDAYLISFSFPGDLSYIYATLAAGYNGHYSLTGTMSPKIWSVIFDSNYSWIKNKNFAAGTWMGTIPASGSTAVQTLTVEIEDNGESDDTFPYYTSMSPYFTDQVNVTVDGTTFEDENAVYSMTYDTDATKETYSIKATDKTDPNATKETVINVVKSESGVTCTVTKLAGEDLGTAIQMTKQSE